MSMWWSRILILLGGKVNFYCNESNYIDQSELSNEQYLNTFDYIITTICSNCIINAIKVLKILTYPRIQWHEISILKVSRSDVLLIKL